MENIVMITIKLLQIDHNFGIKYPIGSWYAFKQGLPSNIYKWIKFCY